MSPHQVRNTEEKYFSVWAIMRLWPPCYVVMVVWSSGSVCYIVMLVAAVPTSDWRAGGRWGHTIWLPESSHSHNLTESRADSRANFMPLTTTLSLLSCPAINTLILTMTPIFYQTTISLLFKYKHLDWRPPNICRGWWVVWGHEDVRVWECKGVRMIILSDLCLWAQPSPGLPPLHCQTSWPATLAQEQL